MNVEICMKLYTANSIKIDIYNSQMVNMQMHERNKIILLLAGALCPGEYSFRLCRISNRRSHKILMSFGNFYPIYPQISCQYLPK